MTKKNLTIFGTRHWQAHEIPPSASEVLKYIVAFVRPDVGLEEWSPAEFKKESAFKAHCDTASPQVPWKNIGTPATAELKTFHERLGYHPHICEYGPLDVQARREILMCENIHNAMSTFESGMLLIGEAHLHSMAVKLSSEFDVEAYAHFPPP